jgi:hypothetical protein
VPLNNHFRELWAKAGYRGDFGSAAVIPPPNKGTLAVYHLTSAEHAISDIALSRLKLARIDDLNDPFELMAVNLREPRLRRAYRDLRSRENDTTGLICFSADWTNPVLWSHYGDKHRGVCLGFGVKAALVQEVNYEEERLENFVTDTGKPLELSPEQLHQLKRTKYKHWEYEQEWRMFVPLKEAANEGSLYFRGFGRGLRLREVILGPQCILSLPKVRRLVSAHHDDVSTIKARLAYKFFKVVPNARTVPRAA